MTRPYPSVASLTLEEHKAAYFAHRVNYLPIALDNARRKIRALENEARRYGLTELLEAEGPHEC